MLDLRQYNCSGRGAARGARPLAGRSVPDRGGSRARERAAHVPAIQGSCAAARAGIAGCGVRQGLARRHHHDESVEMADFGVRDFFCGGVLVPLDYKLTPEEQLKLLAHSKAEVLIVEYHLWRAITQGRRISRSLAARVVLVTEAPPEPISRARSDGRSFAMRASRCLWRGRAAMRRASCIRREPAGGRKAAC